MAKANKAMSKTTTASTIAEFRMALISWISLSAGVRRFKS